MVAEMNGCEQNVENYVSYVEELKKNIAEMQEYFPVICGNGAYSILSLVDMTQRRTDSLKWCRRFKRRMYQC